ncbi:multidrug resistance efflux pump [Novosphingobium hassiacum]|jgi:multidrug resistance efflux pump|uniref:Multidrug resistance efflux pump n=1 Tax=Novosphingobium hassiacum TaxID=173676 RepID=A0A7W5ZX73_9SPHN|nr:MULTISPECIES: HlyD family secretion protein [Pseudomonadota]MBK6491342.1 HlyD family secretion protein [Sphingomonadales bacterium]MBP6435356.1 HlyD family secretion protein [Sphingorhabdus sp.]MCC6480469.1 HlyD family secretion protein [Sphingomonadaceae bacterium]MCH4153015.1 HlyD family secretion protein [Sphingobium sp.]MBB3860982.1 multidrug resistance efflux pump [Novosphingobium hassiacum]
MNDDNADREPTATPAGPAAETGAADAAPTQENPEGWAPERSRKKTIFFAVAIVLGALAALYAWQLPPFRSDSQTTDNAYVRGQTTIISPQVTGYVTEVLVQDFAQVAAGQALVRIDDRIYRQRVAQGQAGIATQTASLDNAGQNRRSSEAQVRLQEASVANARAQLAKAQADMRRVDELADEGSVSLRERDQTLAALRQAQAGVTQAMAQRDIAREQLRSVNVGQGGLEAQVENATASRDLAQIDLDNTIIRAPRAGRLSEVAVREGQLVSPGAQLMYLVPERLWVVANFKEAQTAEIRVGQSATLEIDALGGLELTGKVQSVSPAAGSEFSVIKPDTGAGNFVKVPQRIAVRIRIDPGQRAAQRLGPGMSVIATVHTGDR